MQNDMWDQGTQEIWIMPGKVDKLMERSSAMLLVLFFLGCNICYALLPASIPAHFVKGSADDFMSKAYFFVLPSIGIFVYLILSLLGSIATGATYDDPRQAEQHRRSMMRKLLALKLAVLLACILEMGETVRHSYKELGEPGWYATIWEALLLLTPLVYYLVNLKRIRTDSRTQPGTQRHRAARRL